MDKLEQVRGLLAKAERTDNHHERDAYTAKAQQLISAHGIDAALLDAERADKSTVNYREIKCYAPYANDRTALLNGVYKAMGCEVILMCKAKGDLPAVVRVYGFDADLDRAEIIYTSLLVQAMRGMNAEVGNRGGEHHRTVAANRRSWFLGFTSVVVRRVREAEQAAKNDAETTGAAGTALVLRIALWPLRTLSGPISRRPVRPARLLTGVTLWAQVLRLVVGRTSGSVG
jgi:hypothetical protein